jgi:hypothetical protein
MKKSIFPYESLKMAKMSSFLHVAHLSYRMEKSIFPYGPLKKPYAKIKIKKFETSVSHSYELQIG